MNRPPTKSRCPVPRKRRGAVVYEAMMAIVIAAAVLVGVVHMAALSAQMRRSSDQRSAAAHEAGNLMEDLMSRPWDQVTPETVKDLSLSPSCRNRLPEPRLRVEVTAEEKPADGKRIDIQIDWRIASNHRVKPVRLVAWRYRQQEAAP